MNFPHTNRTSGTRPIDYILSVILIMLSFVLGQLPMSVAYFNVPFPSSEPIFDLQESFGLTSTFVLMVFPLIFTFLVQLLLIKYWHRWSIVSVFTNRSKIDYKRILLGSVVWLGIMILSLIIDWNENIHWTFDWFKFMLLLPIALLLVPLQCAAEELFFRGYLMQWVTRKFNKVWLSVLFTGLLFGALHFTNPEMEALGNSAIIYYMWTGIFLGILAVVDNGIELPLGYHFGNNLFGVVVITTDWQVFHTDALLTDTNPPSFTYLAMSMLIIGQFAFFFFFKKMYNWKLNWTQFR